eukprot:1145289-Pelagomonas_calceolata.AAC.3
MQDSRHEHDLPKGQKREKNARQAEEALTTKAEIDSNAPTQKGKITSPYPPIRAAEQKHRGLQPDLAKKCSTHKTWT